MLPVPKDEMMDDGRDGEQHGHPFHVQPVLHVVHRPTGGGPVRRKFTVLVRQRHFDELGGHAQHGGHQHPEQGGGPAEMDGQRNARDITGAHGAREGGRQRAEMRGITLGALLVVLARDHQERVAEVADLRELQVQGEEKAGADQQINKPGRAANVAVDGGENFIQCVHGSPS